MKRKTSLLHRVVAMVLTIIMIISMIPSSMIPAFALDETDVSLGTLSAITSGGMVTDGNSANALVSYDSELLTLEWDPADPSLGRTSDGWWVGVKMTAPFNMTKAEDFTNVVLQSNKGEGWSDDIIFWDVQDSDKELEETERYLTMWGLINEERLNTALANHETLDYEWQFDWNGDGVFEQNAALKIDPAKVQLTKDGEKVYPAASGTVSTILAGMAVQGTSNTNIVEVLYETSQTLVWEEADPSIGRTDNGWWTGIKMTAPSGMTTAADFTGVVLQTNKGNGWSDDIAFWDVQDSNKNADDIERYVTMWGLLNETKLNNAVANKSDVEYSWRFDWNADGVFEQMVILKVDPEKITLNSEDGEQVYPELGVVTPIHQGEVTGITGNVVVTYEELTLSWESKNTAIGRNEDGWWTGIKVEVPSELTTDDLKKVKLQQIRYGETNWGTEMNFWDVKTSSDTDSTHYVRMWMNLTPAKLTAAEMAGENITHQYRFDWDGNGTYDQYITVLVVPSTDIVLTKVAQTGFEFAEKNPADIWIGVGSYTNTASGGEGESDKITYEIVEGSNIADINSKTGELTFKGNSLTGRVEVKATKEADDVYAQAEAHYVITIVKEDLEHKFTNTEVTLEYEKDKIYTENHVVDKDNNEIVDNEDIDITYSIEAENGCATIDSTTGDVTIVSAGTATITATLTSDLYNEKVLTYTLTIYSADQSPLSFVEKPADGVWEIPYSTELLDILGFVGGSGDGAVTYTITDENSEVDFAEVEYVEGKAYLKTLRAGTFTIKLEKVGDACYNATSISANVTITETDQEELKFENAVVAVTYNENGNLVENKLVGGSGTGEVTYEIVSGNDYVKFEETNNEKCILRIMKAGNTEDIIVKVTKAGDECYKEASNTFALRIDKANQSFTFKDKEVSKLYGTVEYLNEVIMTEITDTTVAADGVGYGTGAFTYSIVGENNIGAVVDTTSGEITFEDSEQKAGKITVKAVKAADDCYKEAIAEYTLEVLYLDTPGNPYELSGETLNESGWYTNNVTITAPEGYTISYANKISTTDWASSVEYIKEGDNSATVYLKNADGYMTDAIVIDSIKVDKQNPQAVSIIYDKPFAEKFKNVLSFGIYKEKLEVTVTAKDTMPGSGIALLKVDKGNGYEDVQDFTKVEGEDGTVSYTFTILPEYRDIISMYATDISGREAKILTDGKAIVIDTTDPTLEVGYEYSSGEYREYNEILYTKGDTTVNFWITEANFDLSLENEGSPVVTINGKEVALAWEFNEVKNRWESKTTISGEGEYVINLTYTDVVERKVTYEKELHIDNTPADISVVYDNNDVSNEIYYDALRKPTFTIEEDNFEPTELQVTVTAKGVQEKPVTTVDVTKYQEYLQDINNWSKDESGDIIKYITKDCPVFEEDAIYDITIEYTDLAGNEATLTDHFVIDTTKPENLTISYSESHRKPWEKVLNFITFGMYYAYTEKVEVTITAEDLTFGIDYFEWTYTKEEGTSEVNHPETKTEIISKKLEPGKEPQVNAISYSADGKTATAMFELTAKEAEQYRGHISFVVGDYAGNEADLNDSERINIVDNVKPVRYVTYSEGRILDAKTFLDVKEEDVTEQSNVIRYYKEEVTVNVHITEANFYKEDVHIYVTSDVRGTTSVETEVVAEDINWTESTEADTHVGTFVIAGNGDYSVRVDYTDRSNNVMDTFTSPRIAIDDVDPSVSMEFTPKSPIVNPDKPDLGEVNTKYFNCNREAKVTIIEHNFRADDVKITVTAKDVTGTDIARAKAIQEELQNWLITRTNWTPVNGEVDMYETTIPFVDDAHYTVELTYADIIGNTGSYKAADFVIDKTAPKAPVITYSEEIKFWSEVLEKITIGFYSYNPNVTVTMTVDDVTAGVDYFEWTYTREDGVSETLNVAELKGLIENKSEITYSNNGKTAKASFTLTADEAKQYRGSISCVVTDRAGNDSTTDDNKRINIVDTIAPNRVVTYSKARVLNAKTMLDVESFNEGDNVILYYEKEAIVTLDITEANFYSEDVEITVTKDGKASKQTASWIDVTTDKHVGTLKLSGDGDYYVTVKYVDRSKNEMVTYQSPKVAIDNKNPVIDMTFHPEKPVVDEAKPDLGDVNEKYYNADRSATVIIEEHNFRADDVKVTVTAKDVTGADIARAAAIQEELQKLLVTRTSWTSTKDTHKANISFVDDAHYTVEITYADLIGNNADAYNAEPFVVDKTAPTVPVITYSEAHNFWEQVKSAITFGYYAYNPDVIVTVTVDDITAGVDYFEWAYTREDGVSETLNVKSTSGLIEKKTDIAYGNNGKTATAVIKLTADEAKQYRGYISCIVTDRAGNDSSVADSKRINVVDTISPTRVVTYTDANQVVDASTLKTLEQYNYAGENTNVILYYKDSVTATFTITEANFYKEDVVIKVNGVAQTVTNWTQNGDVWTASITLSAEGDYIVTMDYTDRSLNVMNTYTSQRIVIDKTLPVITVDYANKDIKNTVRDSEGHNRNYYDAVQTATITIKEHNFRPDDVVVRVTAKNVIGQDVSVSDYAALALRRAEWEKLTPYETSWRRENDTYKLVIQYPVDANYTFDIEYTDLATNEASDYTEDYFTVDKTAPTNLDTSYSTSILERVLETVTFGYYDALVTVTIQAEDETSGVYHFMYSYLKSANVSQVNAELIDQAIRDAAITYSGKTATATFTIPERVLSNNNQFNGTVEFTSYDRAENDTEEADNVRVVVDNINPVATVTYNEPVQSANNISYYAGDINATVVINEANFYAEDVIVSVTKNGASVPVSVNWINNSVDVHTGTFTLTQDGAYYVNITYKDRSANEMSAYLSNELTIDTEAPSIEVSQIKMNSANKDEVYGFTITASDTTYLDTSTFTPVLKAVLRGEDGTYKTETISLGDMQTVVNGQTYAFTVENLAQDAVYSLTCVVKDMAGNEISHLLLSEENEAYEDVKFSVNREGSTYSINETTDKLINTYYVQNVGNDVVIEEVNVDPVEHYVVKLNGQELKEGTDYTTTLENEQGKWSKRTYVINKDLFEEEGEYNVVVESTDKTNTVAYSDVKSVKIAFVVDQTKPELIISGLEENGNYEAEKQEVVVIPTDNGGKLNSLEVVLLDSDGNFVETLYKSSGEELLADISEDGEIRFEIPEGVRHQIQIICNDCALNEEEETNEYNEVFEAVTVSPNKFLIAFLDFYYNKLAFYGSIAGLLALIAAIVVLIVFKKKKKEEQK